MNCIRFGGALQNVRFCNAPQLVDVVDKLLDGDAGSRRLTDVRLVPSVPASATPALENRRKHMCFRRFSLSKKSPKGGFFGKME